MFNYLKKKAKTKIITSDFFCFVFHPYNLAHSVRSAPSILVSMYCGIYYVGIVLSPFNKLKKIIIFILNEQWISDKLFFLFAMLTKCRTANEILFISNVFTF